jgi:predicted Rossmann-fold nucleotide-binding protein
VDGYYDDLLALFQKAFSEQFIRTEHRQLIIHAAHPAEILDQFAHYQPPTVQKWLDADET